MLPWPLLLPLTLPLTAAICDLLLCVNHAPRYTDVSVSGVVDLTIKTATLAAGQLQAPPDASAAAAGGPSSAAGAQPPLVVGSLVSTVALHSLRASCSSLQQLLLLLGCISQLGSLGSVPLTADEQASIAADLISPLATALRSAAVALWLCKTPASAPVAGAATGVSKSAGDLYNTMQSCRCMRVAGASCRCRGESNTTARCISAGAFCRCRGELNTTTTQAPLQVHVGAVVACHKYTAALQHITSAWQWFLLHNA